MHVQEAPFCGAKPRDPSRDLCVARDSPSRFFPCLEDWLESAKGVAPTESFGRLYHTTGDFASVGHQELADGIQAVVPFSFGLGKALRLTGEVF